MWLVDAYNYLTEFNVVSIAVRLVAATLLGSMVAGANEEIRSLFSDSKTAAIITKKNSAQEIYCIHIYIPLCKEAKMYG